MEPAFCGETRKVLYESAKELGIKCHEKGTSVVIEGPRFSTLAESNVFRCWGAHLVNMTLVPEVNFISFSFIFIFIIINIYLKYFRLL